MAMKSLIFLLHAWFNFRFHEHWRFVLQRLVFLSAFVVYLEGENLVTREEVAQILGSRYRWVYHAYPALSVTTISVFAKHQREASAWSSLNAALSKGAFSLCSWGGSRERISPGCGGLPGWRVDHGKWTGESALEQRTIYMFAIDLTIVLVWRHIFSTSFQQMGY